MNQAMKTLFFLHPELVARLGPDLSALVSAYYDSLYSSVPNPRAGVTIHNHLFRPETTIELHHNGGTDTFTLEMTL